MSFNMHGDTWAISSVVLQNYSNKLYQDGLYGDGKLNGDFPSSYKYAQPQLYVAQQKQR